MSVGPAEPSTRSYGGPERLQHKQLRFLVRNPFESSTHAAPSGATGSSSCTWSPDVGVSGAQPRWPRLRSLGMWTSWCTSGFFWGSPCSSTETAIGEPCWIFLISVVFAGGIELVQTTLPYRQGDWQYFAGLGCGSRCWEHFL